MADASILRFLRYGAHADANSWTTAPTMSTFAEPEGEYLLDSRPRHVDRGSVQRGNGQRVPRVTVGKDTSATLPELTLGLRGLSGSGAGNITNTNTLSHDLDAFLVAVFGLKTEGVGDTFSGTPGSGVLLLADGAVSMTAGQGVLMLGATDGKYVARQVVSTSGSNFTIDRDLYTDTGTAQDPTADSVIYGGRTYALTATTPNRIHWGFDAEGDNFRNRFWGIMGSATLRFMGGTYATMTLTGMRFTDCDDDDEQAVANPTYSAPTRGSLIQCIDMPMFLGATPYIMAGDGLEIDLGLTIAPRGTNGPNGPFGYVVSAVNPVLRWSMVAGTGTAPTEVTDTILATLRNDTPKDFACQIGRTIGGTCYVRAPALDIVAERSVQDGVEVINCVGTPTDASATVANYVHMLSVSFF